MGRRDVPRGMGAIAHREVGLGCLVLFRCAWVYRRELGVRDEFWREGLLRVLWGKKGCATWDGGNSTWGGRVRVFGTVSMCLGVQERAGCEGRVLAGRVVKGTVGLVRV
nr:hypothetical protein [Tanacetum cinerariifolium]